MKLSKNILMVGAGLAALVLFLPRRTSAGGIVKTTGISMPEDRAMSTANAIAQSVNATGVSAQVQNRKHGAPDYRDLVARATTASDIRKARENELRTARNTKTAIASDASVGGVPLPYVTGAMAPQGVSQPGLMSLANYIRAGFRFTGEGINSAEYARNNADFVRLFEDWRARFGMPINW